MKILNPPIARNLKEYVDFHFTEDNVIILGDFNDELGDTAEDNVFIDFLNDESYYFADISIAEGPSSDWSFPNWPSHLDHILLAHTTFDFYVTTLKLEDYIIGGWDKYNNYISDHRPVGLNILLNN